jgi:ribosomal protein S18 acetylase RimI-like enzyme
MKSHSITLRAAAPNFDEGLAFAHYLDEAFEGFVSSMLGRRSADIVAMAFIQPRHAFSYRNTIFAEQDNTIVGMATGYNTKQHHRFSELPLKQAAGNNIIAKLRVNLLCLRLRLLGTHVEGDFYLQAVAVNRAFWGRSIGTVLLDAIEEQARAKGATRFFLDVHSKNKVALRFYERRGMVVEPRKTTIPFMTQPIVQMTKLL